MKQCPNCHTLFSDQEQFCPVCGTWVGAQYNKNDQFSYPGSKKKSRSKIILKTVLGCFAVIAAGTLSYVGAVHFFFPQNESADHTYAEAIDAAERYLQNQNYTQARDGFQKAMNIDPCSPESYLGLYEVHAIRNDEEGMRQVLADGKDNLSSEDYSLLQEKSSQLATQYPASDQWSVITEIGKLDQSPIRLGEDLWIIKQNEQYSFLDTNGEIQSQNPSDYLQYVNESSYPAAACLVADYVDTYGADRDQWSETDSPQFACLGVGGEPDPIMILERTSSGSVRLSDRSMEHYLSYKDENGKPAYNPLDDLPDQPMVITDASSGSDSLPTDYWIWNPQTDQLTGPYSIPHQASFVPTRFAGVVNLICFSDGWLSHVCF